MTTDADRLLDQLFADESAIERITGGTEAEAFAYAIAQGEARGLEVSKAQLVEALSRRELPDAILAMAAGGGATTGVVSC